MPTGVNYVMFLITAFVGVHRWQCRMWSLVTQFLQHDSINKMSQAEIQEWEDKIFESRNYFLKEVCVLNFFRFSSYFSVIDYHHVGI